eukprot:658783-Hanusia_phi.AAC.2
MITLGVTPQAPEARRRLASESRLKRLPAAALRAGPCGGRAGPRPPVTRRDGHGCGAAAAPRGGAGSRTDDRIGLDSPRLSGDRPAGFGTRRMSPFQGPRSESSPAAGRFK